MKTSPLIAFYKGEATDSEGRNILDIFLWSNKKLEEVHDYIQWLFPLREESRFNRDAPLLTDDDVAAFHGNARLQLMLRHSLEMMLEFYGLKLRRSGDKFTVECAPSFTTRFSHWVMPRNHNFLRITRILKSLCALGLRKEATAFFSRLSLIYDSHKDVIGEETFGYWQDAISLR